MRTIGGESPAATLLTGLRESLSVWEHPLWAAATAAAVYILLARFYAPLDGVSRFGYYNYLADAFLHGQLALRVVPHQVHDLVFYAGKYYLYWPPFPALLMAPFVALFGVGFSDVLFTALLGGLNVGMVALLLRELDRKRLLPLSRLRRALLVIFFSFGTVHLVLASFGRVWYTGEVVGFTCVALAYLAAVKLQGWQAFFFTGLALAAAMITRNHLVFAGIWPAYILWKKTEADGWRVQLADWSAAAAPLLVAGGLFAAYNIARFGSPLNVGLDYHLMAQNFVQDYQRYGAFSLHYLPANLFYQYVAYPFPLSQRSLVGGSLFLLSPVFLAAFWGIARDWRSPGTLALLVSILLVNIPILLLMGTGWVQFGPRYTLDFTLPLLLLTAKGLPRWRTSLFACLVLVSVVQYVVGAFFFIAVV